MNESTCNPSATSSQPDLFGVCDMRVSDLVGQPDHLSDAPGLGQADVSKGLLGLRGDPHGKPASPGSSISTDVEPVACKKCESNSHVYTTSACCQSRLRDDQMVHALRLASGQVLRAHGLASRQEVIRNFTAQHGAAQAEKLKALVSSLWSERGV